MAKKQMYKNLRPLNKNQFCFIDTNIKYIQFWVFLVLYVWIFPSYNCRHAVVYERISFLAPAKKNKIKRHLPASQTQRGSHRSSEGVGVRSAHAPRVPHPPACAPRLRLPGHSPCPSPARPARPLLHPAVQSTREPRDQCSFEIFQSDRQLSFFPESCFNFKKNLACGVSYFSQWVLRGMTS